MLQIELEDELEYLKDSNLYRRPARVDSDQSSRITIDNKECISLSSNNYLGLANHPSLKNASINAVNNFGTGTGSSRLVSGNTELHERLEQLTSEFKRTDAALLFNTGYMANIGLLQALTDERDVIFSDELNHASIIDGCRLSRAKVCIYHHRDSDHLRSLLSKAAGSRRRFVITDSVFSMDGDIAPLPDIIETAKEHDASVIVDDAHATGVLGEGGRGSLEHFGISDNGIIQMGTYSKALGSFGAYIAGNQVLREYLINKSRAFIFTTALPPSVIAASIASLQIVGRDRERLRRLWINTERFRSGLKALGFNVLNSETPIIPVITGDAEKTLLFSNRLFQEGIHAAPIRPPAVPEGSSRIRTTMSAVHSESEIEYCLKVFEKAGREIKGLLL